VSGDVRRVLQLCRKAAEICEEEGTLQVGPHSQSLQLQTPAESKMGGSAYPYRPLDSHQLAGSEKTYLIMIIHPKRQGQIQANIGLN